METANAFTSQYILDFNRRFAVQPRSHHDAHRPLLFSDDELDIILSRQETRTLSKNLTLQYNRVIYQIETSRASYAMRNAKVTVCENAQGVFTILYKGRPLNFSIFHQQQRQAEVVSSKEIDSQLHKLKKPHKPAADHPWRQYGQPINGKAVSEKAV